MDAISKFVMKRRRRPVFFFFGSTGGATLADPVPVGGIGEPGLGLTVFELTFNSSGLGGSLGTVADRGSSGRFSAYDR